MRTAPGRRASRTVSTPNRSPRRCVTSNATMRSSMPRHAPATTCRCMTVSRTCSSRCYWRRPPAPAWSRITAAYRATTRWRSSSPRCLRSSGVDSARLQGDPGADLRDHRAQQEHRAGRHPALTAPPSPRLGSAAIPRKSHHDQCTWDFREKRAGNGQAPRGDQPPPVSR